MNLGTIWSNKPAVNRVVRAPPVKNNPQPIKNVNSIATRSFWGTAVWYFFHTISCRINENFYNSNYEYIWGFIKKICHTLPCPYCQEHARKYISKISINQVRTKNQLKNVLFNFHNNVNSRIGKRVENISILDKYNRANIKKIFDLFENRFFHSYIGRRQFDDWIKNEVKSEYYSFYNKVRTNFN
tara:strand:- start:546 stop:1100 length:555 start_codon:yes stop_codon:yes gene_type:complete